ncbi:hypothetical protein CsSME_00019776 [Camellia sinensis var. sinensis]
MTASQGDENNQSCLDVQGDGRHPKRNTIHVLCRRALKVTRLGQFLVLSSSSGNACAQNLVIVAADQLIECLMYSEEPTEPFYYLQLDPPTREVKLE